jgi:PAS domain-containing protein
MKYSILLKTVELTPYQIGWSNPSPCDRERFLERYSKLVQKPADQIILDKLDILTYELDTSFSSWNSRWEDIIGETTVEEIRYKDKIFDIWITEESRNSLIETYKNRLSNFRSELEKLNVFQFIKKSCIKERIQSIQNLLDNDLFMTKQTKTIPSFKRNWYLDVYY